MVGLLRAKSAGLLPALLLLWILGGCGGQTGLSPDTSPPDTDLSDTFPSDTSPSDTSHPDTFPSDTSPSDTSHPDTYPSDTFPSDTYPSDTYPSDTFPSDTYHPDTTHPDTSPSDTSPSDTSPSDTQDPLDSSECPSISQPCLEEAFLFCDPDTLELVWRPRPQDSVCLTWACDPALGWVSTAHEALPCDDGNDCTQGDLCQGGQCLPGVEQPCEDDNPCTINTCLHGLGCAVAFRNGQPCDDADACTSDDACNGLYCQGTPVACSGNSACDETSGLCTCALPCLGLVCGEDACGNPCGDCPGGAACEAGACVFHYPPPPYGPFEGDTIPDFAFLDPSQGQEVRLSQFQGQGRLILLVFSAGWCSVCKKDAALFNQWVGDPAKADLQILEVYYEDYYMKPATAQSALAWKNGLSINYPLLLDNPTLGPEGKASGGVLAQLQQPLGPLDPGYFPPVVLICPGDLRILHLRTGFPQNVLLPMIDQWLAEPDCTKAQ